MRATNETGGAARRQRVFRIMNTSNKCPKCAGEMQEGFMNDRSYASQWIVGKPDKGFFAGAKISSKEKHFIQTFRCAKCGYLESYARES